MKGNLADGTAMSQSVSVSKDGRWPFYAAYAAPPAGNGGAVFGWITFSNQPASSLGGTDALVSPGGQELPPFIKAASPTWQCRSSAPRTVQPTSPCCA